MESNDQVYKRLQRHLDKQAIGFPATKSGTEIKILKYIFTPEEAEIVTFLSYKSEPVDTIFKKAAAVVKSEQELVKILERIHKKGGIEVKRKNGIRHYRCLPFVVGMYEFQLGRLTPEFIKDADEYMATRDFGVDLISTALPQMRTIPIKKSIYPEHNVSTYDEITSLMQQADGPFVILKCLCRNAKSMKGEPCKVTDRKETCLGIGEMAKNAIEIGAGREINKEEAILIIEENQKDGLVLQPSNTKDLDFVCSCCGCCCGMLNAHKGLPKPLTYWATNYFAVVDTETCKGCGTCEKNCQVDAVKVSEKEKSAVVNLDRCIGCGICVSKCPTESISLSKKSKEASPPQNSEELLDIIAENKKGKFGKLMVTGKLIYDAVRTGQTHLLK